VSDIHVYCSISAHIQVPARLTQRENVILAAFSVLYTINIAVSNISLQLVTVPVSQLFDSFLDFDTS